MIHFKWIVILVILLLTGIIFLFLPSDEKKIEKKLAAIGEYCSTPKDEAAFETLKKVGRAAELCTHSCRVSIDSLKIDKAFSPKEISDHLLMMKKRLPETTFSFHDTIIDIQGESKAAVITTLTIDGESVDGRFVDAYEIDIEMKKKNGEWLFSAFKVVEFMNK